MTKPHLAAKPDWVEPAMKKLTLASKNLWSGPSSAGGTLAVSRPTADKASPSGDGLLESYKTTPPGKYDSGGDFGLFFNH